MAIALTAPICGSTTRSRADTNRPEEVPMTTLRITCGPDEQFSGSAWCVSEIDEEGGDQGDVASGGTIRGPKNSDDPDAWLAWVRRQVAGHLGRLVVDWSTAEVQPAGYSEGAGHAPQGIRVTVDATRRHAPVT
jgi:hypothetical protein